MVVPAAGVDRDERAPRLHEAAGEERALAEVCPAVELARGLVLGGDVEGAAGSVARHERIGFALEGVH